MASRWITLFLLLTPAAVQGADKIENNFGFYPKGAQKCLEDSSEAAGCTSGDSISALNTCLCGNNNNFIINSAKCIGDESPDDVDTTYDTMEEACGNSETPISVKKKAFQDAAAEGQASTTTTATDSETTATSATETAQVTTTTGGKTVTVVPTSDNSNDDKNKNKDDDDGGLSTGATIGIGVGAAVVGAIAVGAGVFFFMRRRKKNAEESHPMLPNYEANHEYTGSTTYPPTEPKPAWSTANTPNQGQQGWGAPDPYLGAYGPQKPAEMPPQNAGNFVYEMDGTTPAPAVEMPGSTPQGQTPQGQQGGWNR